MKLFYFTNYEIILFYKFYKYFISQLLKSFILQIMKLFYFINFINILFYKYFMIIEKILFHNY
jgi:hypothetical protein